MAKRALSWKRAAAIAWRDLKSAPGKFGFVILSVAVGVAALVGVRGLSGSFRSTLNTQARSLLAGDLSARMFRAPTQEERNKILEIEKQSGGAIRSTWTTETVSMASVPSDPVPLLVSLKAVDPAEYPYYGTAEIEPAMPLQQALQGDSAIVADEFLIRLNAHVGETLRLGDKNLPHYGGVEAGARSHQQRYGHWSARHDFAGIARRHRTTGARQPRYPAPACQTP